MAPVRPATTKFATLSSAALALTTLLLVGAAATGCNFFEPADPEPPIGGGIVPRFAEPETTLVTMGAAIMDKSATNGETVYAQCLADTASENAEFHAFFDPATLERFHVDAPDWDREREKVFYTYLARQRTGLRFVFAWGPDPGAPDDDHQATTALLYRSYQLFALGDNSSVTVAKGFADLYFIKNQNNQWKLVRWQDHEDPAADFENNEFSFGQLRMAGPQ